MTRVITLICLFFPCAIYAQIMLKGSVKDGNAPIPGASIVLTNTQDKIVVGAITKDNGNFEMTVKNGDYKIRVGFIGYKNWEQAISLQKNTDLGTITLLEEKGNLKEVQIIARKPIFEQKADRIIYHIENNISVIGGGATDALRGAAGISIQNGNISMLGKGNSRIMVNGRMIELTGQELINFLNSIPAGDIKNIEIISNPPAKYEASGDGGIININLKKGGKDAWKNTTTLSYDQNKYAVYTLRNHIFYNKDKINFSANAGGKLGNLKTMENLNTYYPTGQWDLQSIGKQKQDHISGGFALDYNPKANTSMGLQYNGNYNNPDRDDHTEIAINNTANRLQSILINTGKNDLNSANHALNVHFLTNLDTSGRKFSLDADYFNYGSKIDNNFVANNFSPTMELVSTDQSARNIAHQQIRNTSLKVDIEYPLNWINLSYGAKASFTNSTGNVQYYNTISGEAELDVSRSNNFEYQEQNQAIYLNGNKNLNSKLSIQLGLRIENTQTIGYSASLNQTHTNNYFKFFPTFYATYKSNDSHSFLFNYGRRINRPNFELLNPFRSYLNSKSYSEGNPFLQPSFNDNFDLTHVYKGKLRSNLFFNVVSNGFGIIFSSNPDNNTQIISRQNYYQEYYFGLGETYTASLKPWWQTQTMLYLLGSRSNFSTTINAVPNNGTQLYLNTSNTFTLGKNTKLQADYFYSSAFKHGLYTYGNMSGINLSIKQNLFNNKMQLAFLVNDIFNTSYLKDYTSIVNGIKQVYSQNNSSRYFRLSLVYSFGNSKINAKERNFGNEEERKRTQ